MASKRIHQHKLMLQTPTKRVRVHKVRINEVREQEAEQEIRTICTVCKGSGGHYMNAGPSHNQFDICAVCNGTGYDNNRS